VEEAGGAWYLRQLASKAETYSLYKIQMLAWELESGLSFSSLENCNVHLQVATFKTKTELHSFT
jgi:hypothetical protein